ncbi:NUDIX domain-containing protein [soil metagenome]
MFTSEFWHPAVATDVAIFTLRKGALSVMLIRRAQRPFKGAWALPGGFFSESDADLDACARRKLVEKTGVSTSALLHFGNYSASNRDDRERVISIAYFALLPFDQLPPRADADEVDWFDPSSPPPNLAFDHQQILNDALNSLRDKCRDFRLLLTLLPRQFTFTEMHEAYQAVMGRPEDRRNLHKAVLAAGAIEETTEMSRGRHRPARLFTRSRPATE